MELASQAGTLTHLDMPLQPDRPALFFNQGVSLAGAETLNRLVFFGVAVAVLLGLIFVFPVGDWVLTFLGWVQSNQGTSWLVFIAAYVLACVLLVPGSLLTLGAGFVFGLPAGLAIVSLSSTLGASAAFLTGRYFVRDWVENKLSAYPRFAALDRAVGERGALIVLLTRLSPVFPFNLLNYGLGITRVKFWHYVGASWLGMLPGTALYVYLGSAGQSLTALFAGELETSVLTQVMFAAGLGATLLLTILITRFANQALNAQLENP